MLLLIDNFDSFTYNLVQYFQILGVTHLKVIRNNAHTLFECEQMSPSAIVISPGPGTPSEAGITKEVIRYFAGKVPIFGVCLGLQAIAEEFGGKVVRAKYPVHGKTSAIHHEYAGVFRGLPQGFHATRYHSLIVERESLPSELEVTASTSDGEIMGLRHHQHSIEGVQFHPESILTKPGLALLKNFLENTYC